MHWRLQSYAALYRATYGEAEAVPDLIPLYVLDAFLDSDRAFAKAQKAEPPPVELPVRRPGERGQVPIHLSTPSRRRE